MYKIIGADQKEYGPISGDQIRQWMSEGRVNAHTRARLEGEQDWKPLSEFPEFAAPLGGSPTGAPPTVTPLTAAGGGREAALQAVRGPAIGLIVTAILGLFLAAIGFIMNILTIAGSSFRWEQMGDPRMQRIFESFSGGIGILGNIIGVGIGIVILMGAFKMQSLKSHQFAFTASILAMLPCISPCCILGLPFGIWALVVLNRPEVKSQFS